MKEEIEKQVANKHNLGNSLVTGHTKKYFMEYADIYSDTFAVEFYWWMATSGQEEEYTRRHGRIDPKMDGSHIEKEKERLLALLTIFKTEKGIK